MFSWAWGSRRSDQRHAITNLLFSCWGTRVNSVLGPQSFVNLRSALRKDQFTGFSRMDFCRHQQILHGWSAVALVVGSTRMLGCILRMGISR